VSKRAETVAELGGEVLLVALGFEQESDRGGCFEYVKGYAEVAGIEPVQAVHMPAIESGAYLNGTKHSLARNLCAV